MNRKDVTRGRYGEVIKVVEHHEGISWREAAAVIVKLLVGTLVVGMFLGALINRLYFTNRF